MPRDPRKIFMYSINYAPELSGVGRYSGELAEYLVRTGGSLEVLTTAPHYPGWSIRSPYRARYYRESDDGVTVWRCPIWLPQPMRGIWRLLAPLSFALSSGPVAIWRILKQRPQVVIVVEPTLFVAPLALLLSFLVGARTLLHVQDLEVDAAFAVRHLSGNWIRDFAFALERFLLRRFDQVVTISDQMRQQLLYKGVAPERASMIRNWVDLERIRPLSGTNPYRAELQIDPDAFVILYAGNIGAKQALNVVLDSAEMLVHERGIVFVIAGEGPEKPSLIARYGGLPNVKFLPLQPEARLCEFLCLPDLHVLPQDRRASDLVLPSKLGGMLASGRPLLVTADPGTELHTFLAGAASLVPSGDSVALANEIRRMADVGGCCQPRTEPRLLALLDARSNLKEFADLIWDTPSA